MKSKCPEKGSNLDNLKNMHSLLLYDVKLYLQVLEKFYAFTLICKLASVPQVLLRRINSSQDYFYGLVHC